MRRPALSASSGLILMTICVSICQPNELSAQEIPPPTAQASAALSDLQLEVYVNGRSQNLIAAFHRGDDGRLSIDAEQLKNVGIKPAEAARRADGSIDIGKLPGIDFEYDTSAQTIHFTAQESARADKKYDATGAGDSSDAGIVKEDSADEEGQSTGIGAVLNYTLYASSGGDDWDALGNFEGLSGAFESRLYSAYGVLSSSQIASTSSDGNYGTKRLDTTWSYSDENRLMEYRLGDIQTGGLSWTRPVRLGGIQIQRDFSLRPDLVTIPMPGLSGSAAVPSTVDVYVNDSRRFSQDVPEGPFSITNLPVITGAGTARLVVRDALGREAVTETPFYTSPSLLLPGLWDISGETGYARRNFGVESNDYDDRLMLSVTGRLGITDWLTGEAHGEGGEDLVNGGLGAVFSLGPYGVANLAGAMSSHDGATGYQIAASLEAEIGGFNLFVRTQRTFGDYDDIASVTADLVERNDGTGFYSARPPAALDQISLSFPSFEKTTLNLNFTQLETAENDRSRLLGMSASRPIGENGNAFLTAYADISEPDSYGIFAGLSWRIGDNLTASTNVSSDNDGYAAGADLVRSAPDGRGLSWRVHDAEGKSPNRLASAAFRGSLGKVSAGIQQFGDSVEANAEIDGALVAAGGGIFLADRVDDAFAVVDVGAPNVDVQIENRPIGRTNGSGKLLVPGLRAHEKNAISIDPANLPLDMQVDTTRRIVRPKEKSGVIVKMRGTTSGSHSRLLTMRDERGAYVETGALLRAASGKGADFPVGYDGQVYISDLKPGAELEVDTPSGGRCMVTLPPSLGEAAGQSTDLICRSAP
jgi:outer membrane usher protein